MGSEVSEGSSEVSGVDERLKDRGGGGELREKKKGESTKVKETGWTCINAADRQAGLLYRSIFTFGDLLYLK